jgi:hypothetical protein
MFHTRGRRIRAVNRNCAGTDFPIGCSCTAALDPSFMDTWGDFYEARSLSVPDFGFVMRRIDCRRRGRGLKLP